MKSAFLYSTTIGKCTLIALVLCILYKSSFAATGDKLVITGNIVNVRSEPSTSADLLIKLSKDREVTEIQRQRDWVEIETNREDIKTGWVHESLLGTMTIIATESPNTSSPTRFDKFKQRFYDQNEIIDKQNGVIYFSEVINKGRGQIEVIATKAWLDSDHEKRGNVTNSIFKLWGKLVPVGNSMSVRVLDEQGEQHMIIIR
jgi:SH3 domain-containing protein